MQSASLIIWKKHFIYWCFAQNAKLSLIFNISNVDSDVLIEHKYHSLRTNNIRHFVVMNITSLRETDFVMCVFGGFIIYVYFDYLISEKIAIVHLSP